MGKHLSFVKLNNALPGTSDSPAGGYQSSFVYSGLTSIYSLVSLTNTYLTSFPLSSFEANVSHFLFNLTSYLFEKHYK